MPRQKRYAIKQQVTTVLNQLNVAQNKIAEIGQIYKENYPDYYKELCLFVEYLEKLKAAVQAFKDKV